MIKPAWLQGFHPIGFSLGVVSCFLIGEMAIFALPLFTSAIGHRFGYSVSATEMVFTAQLLSITVSSLLSSRFVHKVNKRKVALYAAAFVILGNICSAFTDSSLFFIASRIVAGCAEGLVLSAGSAACARSAAASRIYSLASLGVTALSLLIFLCLPRVLEFGGMTPSFIVMAVTIAAMTGLLLFLPAEVDTSSKEAGLLPHANISHFLLLTSTTLFFLSVNMTWFFMNEIGRRDGLELTSIGNAILIASIFSLVGPSLGVLIGNQLGFLKPIGASLIFTAVASIIITCKTGFLYFTFGFSLASMFYVFGIPYFYGLAAKIDGTGRLAAAVRGAGGIGAALAPATASVAFTWGGDIKYIGFFAVVISVVNMYILKITTNFIK
ncbi:MFS transporter [Komagataeibacter sp. FXV3]|uniref:MFS transporter n=1 Tax=Komagataeibacter sp. FXV3 TaxID=2608998 RepID=UPI00187B33F2|nr:MFS transporter [Komagataeibacter sp. FXV3]